MSLNGEITKTDVVIVGAGPVGLFAIFECGMLGMRAHVIDALDMIGGQCSALYPEKPIYDIPGFPEIPAADLINRLEKQAEPFKPIYHLGQQVTDVQRTNDEGWIVTTSAGRKLQAKAVVIAAGAGAFRPKRPPLDGIESYEGTSVHYMVRRRRDFAGQRIVIAGGGDSAVDWALSLHEVAEKVMFVHRRDKFRAAPDNVAKLRQLADEGKIEMVIPYQLSALKGDGKQLDRVVVSTLAGEEKELEADCLLPFFGLEMSLGPIAEWGLNLDKSHIQVNPVTSQTNQPGIFAVGDIGTYENKLKLILSGFHEAAMAAHAIYPMVNPGKELHFEYSTSKGVGGA